MRCKLQLKRCLKPVDVTAPPQLHAFSDGGNDAFGTCVFLRWETVHRIEISFVSAKAFVAPLKQKTIPRLELMGAVAMSRLTSEIERALGYEVKSKRFWIDNEVVIYWLMSESRKYKPFVSTRVQEFQDTHPNYKQQIRYVKSNDNSADCLTKPISIDKLTEWHAGKFSTFLFNEEKSWDSKISLMNMQIDPKDMKLETKPEQSNQNNRRRRRKIDTAMNCFQRETMTFGREMAERFSEWTKLVRIVTILVIMLQTKRLFAPPSTTPLDTELANKRCYWLCQEDMRENMEETSRNLVKYTPFIDNNGIIRGKGRLKHTELDDNMKHPIMLHADHPLGRLFLRHHHRRLLHQGYRVVLANLANEGFIIINGKQGLKSIATRCIFCRIRRRKVLQQRMGDMPSFRIQPRKPPFTTVSMDFFSPLKVKVSRNASTSGSVLIVTCTTTRCIHLELCLTMNTDCCLRAWRRFVSLRGVHPAHVLRIAVLISSAPIP